jgi:hypothetical protein
VKAVAPGTPKAERLKVQRRRQTLRRVRRRTMTALLGLAARTDGVPHVSRAIRAGATRFDWAAKRVERALATTAERPRNLLFQPDPDESARELRELIRQRWIARVPVDQPLVLITQAPRSGGTMLMRLFDGHPQCHAIPHELGALLPSSLPLPRDPGQVWQTLTDPRLAKLFEQGLRQSKGDGRPDTYPFLLPPLVHRGLFEEALRNRVKIRDREVVDSYLTGYFNGRLNYPGLDGTVARRWVTGFEPRAIAQPARIDAFRTLYPDGRLISVVRDPNGFVVSARRWDERFSQLDRALDVWRESVVAALAERERDPSSVAIVPFELLVGDTERTMRALAQFLEIEFRDELLTPTFDGVPMRANSSFPVAEAGRIEAPLTRAEELSSDERDRIARAVGSLYEDALAVALVR